MNDVLKEVKFGEYSFNTFDPVFSELAFSKMIDTIKVVNERNVDRAIDYMVAVSYGKDTNDHIDYRIKLVKLNDNERLKTFDYVSSEVYEDLSEHIDFDHYKNKKHVFNELSFRKVLKLFGSISRCDYRALDMLVAVSYCKHDLEAVEYREGLKNEVRRDGEGERLVTFDTFVYHENGIVIDKYIKEIYGNYDDLEDLGLEDES